MNGLQLLKAEQRVAVVRIVQAGLNDAQNLQCPEQNNSREKRGILTKTFADDVDYHVWGFPFNNQANRMPEIAQAFERLSSSWNAN
jgi:hypothetical protein